MPLSSLPYPGHLITINYITKKILNTDITVLTCNVLHYLRGALIASSTKANAREVAPHCYKTNSNVLGWHVPPLLELNHREGF